MQAGPEPLVKAIPEPKDNFHPQYLITVEVKHCHKER